MEYPKFEQHISNTLSHHSVEVDIATLIKNIHGEKRPSRQFPIWLWLGIMAAVIMIGGYVMGSKRTVTPNQKITTDLETEAISVSVKGETYNTVSQNETLGFVNDNAENDNIVPASKINPSISVQNSNSTIKYISKSKSSDEYSLIKQNLNSVITQSSNQTYLSQTFLNDEHEAKQDHGLTNPVNNKITFVSFLPSTLTELAIGKRKMSTDKVKCPDFKISKGGVNLSIIPEFGVYHPIKNLINNTNESNSVLKHRTDNETSLEGLQGGLYLRATFKKYPMYLQGGINYGRHVEKMKLTYDYIAYDTIQGIISITKSQNGDTITTIWGDIPRKTRHSGSKEVHHSFKLLDLPIGVGTKKRFGAFDIGVEAGLVFNINMRPTGRILATDTSFAAVDAIPNTTFKSQLGMSYYGSLNISKPVGIKSDVYLGLRYRYIPSSYSTTNQEIKQSYAHLGLNLGYIYRFN